MKGSRGGPRRAWGRRRPVSGQSRSRSPGPRLDVWSQSGQWCCNPCNPRPLTVVHSRGGGGHLHPRPLAVLSTSLARRWAEGVGSEWTPLPVRRVVPEEHESVREQQEQVEDLEDLREDPAPEHQLAHE